MSHVKDILESYKIGFEEGHASAWKNANEVLEIQKASAHIQAACDIQAAYDRGLATGAAKTCVNDPRMIKKINGIKLIRGRFGLSLKESKDLYEAILDASGIEWRVY